MLTSILGLHWRLSPILNPHCLTLTLLPSDSDKSPITPQQPSSQPPPSPSSSTTQKDDDGPSPQALAAIFALTGTLGVAAMTAAQLLSGHLLLLALFGPGGARRYMREFLRSDASLLTPDQLAARATMARSPRYAIFLVLFTTLSAGLPEELLKYLPVLWLQGRRRKDKKSSQQQGREKQQPLGKRAAVRAATAASLGFALVELVGYALAARGSAADRASYAQASRTTAAAIAGPSITIILLERVFVSLPGHIATAILSASRGADAEAEEEEEGTDNNTAGGGAVVRGKWLGRWRRVLSAVAPSVVYHGLFDLVLFGASAWVGGHVGWVHPVGTRAVVGTLGLCVCVQGVLYAHTLRAWLGWGKKEVSRRQ
ncbi:hypothetical protein Daus18300_012464 [Diaporthe australafricana]|uniref:Uncharacterized protein n=1 Tax=Diaporthe australafricana TaxID=127596 RepID=A0ABR3W378_9PEZI